MLAAVLTMGAGPSQELAHPYGSFENWARWAAELLGVTHEMPAPVEAEWGRWASTLIRSPSLEQYNLPESDWYDDWFSWAMQVRLAFPGA